MHWSERRRARVNLALGLENQGWTLYGFKEDRSDAMTDYYDPPSWEGIASKDEYVVVVDVKPSNNYILKRSGGFETTRRVPGDNCTKCDGIGREPDGWTYAQALDEPDVFNHDLTRRQTPGAVPLMTYVVSPLYFHEDGAEKYIKCSGLGHTWKLEQVSVDWPQFQANPRNRLWHVEKDGHILDSGIGLGPCASWDQEKTQVAVARITDRIEASIHFSSGNAAIAPAVPGRTVVRRNQAKNGIEVVFPAKPSADVRACLKNLGFRWSRRQGLWYARFSATLWQQIHELLDITSTSSEPRDILTEDPNPFDIDAAEPLTTPLSVSSISMPTHQPAQVEIL